MGQFYVIKTCEIHWNVAFYILNTITVYEEASRFIEHVH